MTVEKLIELADELASHFHKAIFSRETHALVDRAIEALRDAAQTRPASACKADFYALWCDECNGHPSNCKLKGSSVSSTHSATPVMQAAERAAKVVEGWSDAKKQYAERTCGLKDYPCVNPDCPNKASKVTSTLQESGK